jgi:hypothetical protein
MRTVHIADLFSMPPEFQRESEKPIAAIGIEESVSIGIDMISGRVDGKPIAVYGGPGTGKSVMMVSLFDQLNHNKRYCPLLVSLKIFAANTILGYHGRENDTVRRGLCPSELLADTITRQLLGNATADVLSETARDWDYIDSVIENMIEAKSQKFVLLLDDILCLECPLSLQLEELLLELFCRRPNRCLVFASCLQIFASMQNLPCIPTANIFGLRIAPSDTYHHLDWSLIDIVDVQYCGGVPGLLCEHVKSRDDPAYECTIETAWRELMSYRKFQSMCWPPIEMFVDELFSLTRVPTNLKYFTHIFASVATFCDEDSKWETYLYWPPRVIADIFNKYAQTSKTERSLAYAARLFHETYHPSKLGRTPHLQLYGCDRSWALTVRLSLLLWVLRMSGRPDITAVFIRKFFEVRVESIWDMQCHLVQLREVYHISLADLQSYLEDMMDDTLPQTIAVFLFPNYDGHASGVSVVNEYNAMIGVRAKDGQVHFIGVLADDRQAVAVQPDWIDHSVLILPSSQRPSLGRQRELIDGRWNFWPEESVVKFLGMSLAMLYPVIN